MPGRSSDERDGALMRRLKEVGRSGGSGRLGFMTGADGAKRRALVVVARVTQGPDLANAMRALVDAGAEAIEIAPRAGLEGISAVVSSIEAPCGLHITAGVTGNATALGDSSAFDWIHLDASAPARYLASSKVTTLVEVGTEMAPGRAAGLVGLKADVVVIDAPGAKERFVVDTLMALGAVQAATKRPVLAGQGLGLSPDDAAVLRDHGIEGVLLTGGPDVVRAWAQAIAELE